jgi:hypothetical protein
MSDTWSGFCAYAYYGNPTFSMFQRGPWRSDPLVPTDDFFNFRDALKRAATGTSQGHHDPPIDFERLLAPTCKQVEEDFLLRGDLDLYPYTRIPSYARLEIEGASLHHDAGTTKSNSNRFGAHFSLLTVGIMAVGLVGVLLRRIVRVKTREATYEPIRS